MHILSIIGFSLILTSGLLFNYILVEEPVKRIKRIAYVRTHVFLQTVESSVALMERKFGKALPERKKIIKLLKIGERDFGVSHKDILSIMAVESGFKKYSRNTNKDKSRDYGISQQNGRYIMARYRSASRYLKKYKIRYKSVYDKYDIGLNVMSAILYQYDTGKVTKSHRRLISSYNVGRRGYFTNRKIANRYYSYVMKYRNLL